MLNPISFRRGPVTFWTTLVYLALLIPIIIINENPPPAPRHLSDGSVNLTQAWLDLTIITTKYHPYNSHYNDEVRDFLLRRVASILDENDVAWRTDGDGSLPDESNPAVTVFNDLASNYTVFMGAGIGGVGGGNQPQVGQAAYFEGTNILVYIKGKQDDKGDFWRADVGAARRNEKGLTLVNAHYDSVSTGFGATDDGMGVVTCLQILQHFTSPGNQPERGIVVMFNNGEEDFLYGARALGQSPLLPYIHTFLNLEGAGAGGRAILFRTTDKEATEAYAGTSDPFGTVIGSDAFGLGFIRSATDYSVLHNVFGQRGLDLAFFKPRARYHTNQDDAVHASRDSLWHMLSAAIHTTTRLSGDTGDTFVGPRPDGARGKAANGSPSDGVWFDLFGKGFVLFGLRGMFAWSLAVLIAAPLTLIIVTHILRKLGKYYFFASSVRIHDDPDYEPVSVRGWRGCFRFPFALVVAGALTLGSALLLKKVNPFIIYSSRYSVWAMMISLFYFSFWTIMRGANFARPSALHRGYASIWLFTIGWAILVAVTVAEDRLRIGAGYLFVVLQSALFLAALISLVELFALPKMATWGQQVREDHEAREHLFSLPHDVDHPPQLPHPRHESLRSPTAREPTFSGSILGRIADDQPAEDEAEAPTERTPLVGPNGRTGQIRTTFATTYRHSISALVNTARKYEDDGEPYRFEQAWSGNLPSWAWFFQFLLIGPMTIILVAQIGLMLTDAVHQTGSDGSSLLLPYMIVAIFTALLLLPLTPFIHRVTHHVPVLLLVVFTATLIYNLAAFPFSPANRYKAFFIQRINLDTADNKVCYTGIEHYIRTIVAGLPSASGRELTCGAGLRSDLVSCCYDGSAVPPRLSDDDTEGVPPEKGYAGLVTVNATRGDGNTAQIRIDAVNTKACFIEFETPVSRLEVEGGSGWDERFGPYPDGGLNKVKLWHRDWNEPWVVNVEWKDPDSKTVVEGPGVASTGGVRNGDDGELKARDSGLDGTVICVWSDANKQGTIAALDEGLKFAPVWAALTKTAEGLVEGRKTFKV